MKRSLTLTSAFALSLAISGGAMAQNGNGNGRANGNGGGNGQHERGEGNGGGNANRGGGNDSRGGNSGRGNDRANRQVEVRIPQAARDMTRGSDRIERDVHREVEQRVVDNGAVILRRDVNRGLLNGCPPGLAKRDNGCLPPGQARQIERAQDPYNRYNYVWRTLGGDGDYRYRDGYVYRTSQQGGLLGYLPVLGGILSPGNAWPTQYAYQRPTQYLSDYYGLNDADQYRYADGVVYRVDPQTSSIGQVAALLTGQQFNVGQPLPAGYDVYNVPYDYRNRYADSAQSQYRYNDGYVYQVDPTTQLVQAVIQLLT